MVKGFKVTKFVSGFPLGTIEWLGEVDVNEIRLEDFIIDHKINDYGIFEWSLSVYKNRLNAPAIGCKLNCAARATLRGITLASLQADVVERFRATLQRQANERYGTPFVEFDAAAGILRFEILKWT